MKYNLQKGFTLVEMLAVLAIFSILTSVVVFNYSKFRSDTILTNMAYEVALSIREAQIYGVSARGVATGGTVGFNTPYGIYAPMNSSSYYVVADNDKNGYFTGNCLGDDQCVTTYTMQNSIKITGLQYKTNNNCTSESGGLTFLFKRPNPEPYISKNPGNALSNVSLAVITVSSGAGSKYVVVYNNGQVTVTNSLTGICD